MTAEALRAGTGWQPYIGLRAFTADDRDRFFGRAREARDVAALWRANRLTVLYGASGVGKTSLLNAGVIPEIDPARADVWPVGRIHPGTVFPAAASVRSPFTFALLSSWSDGPPPAARRDESILDFVRRRGEREDRYGDPVPILIAIDQAEELFADLPRSQEHLTTFMRDLTEALHEHGGIRLLLSMREEYLAAMLPYERVLSGRSHARSRLLPFGRAAALEAIQRPLESIGRSFEPDAAGELVSDLLSIMVTNARGEEAPVVADTVEPVQVQVVCSALWDSLPADVRVITAAHVREHADVDRFLAGFCNRALTAVATEQRIPAARIRTWLHRHFVTEHGTRGTAYEGLDETAGMPNAVVRALENRHILKAEHRAGTRWYELQHDRLILPIGQADPAEQLESARFALADGALDLAESTAQQAIRNCTTGDLRLRAQAESLLGEIAAERGDLAAAQKRYGTAAGLFEVLQDSATVGQLLAASGRLSLAENRFAAATTDLRAAIGRVPGDLGVQTDLARAMWHMGQPQSATALLDTVLAADPRLPEALRTRGEILADLGRHKEALRDLDEVRRNQQPGTLAARALALALSERLDAAEQEIADALANGPDDGPVLLRAAKVRVLAGDRKGAVQHAAAALAAAGEPLPPHLGDQARELLEGGW